MEDFNANNNGQTHNALILLERLQTDTERLRIERITDLNLRRFLENQQKELDNLKTVIIQKPRFKYDVIQHEIDRLYKIDNNLTGIIIYLDWKDGDNRAFFKHRIKKVS